jgi:hypothetical protein
MNIARRYFCNSSDRCCEALRGEEGTIRASSAGVFLELGRAQPIHMHMRIEVAGRPARASPPGRRARGRYARI